MKKTFNIAIIFSAIIMFSFSFSGCEEENNYDFNSIKPKILGVKGPAEVSAHGLTEFPYTYSMNYYRGGSTIDWNVTTASGQGSPIITLVDELAFKGYSAKIVFPQRSAADVATITVVETTSGGVKSEPYSFDVALNPFCPYTMSDFAGNYSGTEAGTHDDPVLMETTSNLNELKVHGLAFFVYDSWGESWVEGDGSCLMEFSCGDVVTIKRQWIGDSDYPDVYGIEGTGTVDVANKVINLTYEVFYSYDENGGGSSALGPISTVLTLSGVKASEIKNVTKIKK